MKKNLLILGLIITAAIASMAWMKNPMAVMGTPQVGDKAIDLKFLNPEGKEMALSELQGHVVLLDFGPVGVDHAEEPIHMWLPFMSNTKMKNSLKELKALKYLVFH
ncbi:MAG: hypothetical protein R2728_00500 [Chitinophagales bacterium]